MARSNYFQFKQFRVNQDRCAMKVSTDACLLGAYPEVKKAIRILDIGAGTGLLSLMLAQRSDAEIHAVEIVEEAVEQARENIQQSPWSQRIKVFCESIQSYSKKKTAQYDFIISNPPFYQNSTPSKNSKKRLAWHNGLLPFDELIQSASSLLSDDGFFCLILPVQEAAIFKELVLEHELFLKEELLIKPTPGSKANREIITFSKKKTLFETKELRIYEENREYTDEAFDLLQPYYLYL